MNIVLHIERLVLDGVDIAPNQSLLSSGADPVAWQRRYGATTGRWRCAPERQGRSDSNDAWCLACGFGATNCWVGFRWFEQVSGDEQMNSDATNFPDDER